MHQVRVLVSCIQPGLVINLMWTQTKTSQDKMNLYARVNKLTISHINDKVIHLTTNEELMIKSSWGQQDHQE